MASPQMSSFERKTIPNLITPVSTFGYEAVHDWRQQPSPAAGSTHRHEDMVLSLLGLSLAAEQKTTTGAGEIAGLWGTTRGVASSPFF